jgi:hypothetical protein
MDLDKEILAVKSSPQELEQLYQKAQQGGQTEDFQSLIETCHEDDPDNLLFAAWFYRFQQAAVTSVKERRAVNWALAVALGILTGLIFWVLSDIETFIYLEDCWQQQPILCY